MKRLYSLISAGTAFCLVFLLLSGCGKEKDPAKLYSSGTFKLSAQTENITGTAVISKDGAVLDSTVRSPSVVIDNIKTSILNKGILEFVIKNTSDISAIKVEFTTASDENWGAGKEAVLTIDKSSEFKTYTLDMSGVYSYLYTLSGLRITCDGISSGEITIKSIIVKNGGKNYPQGITLSQPEPLYDFKQRVAKGIGYAPDGTLGYWKNSDGSTNFVASLMGKIILSKGSATDPFEKVIYSNGLINNVDSAKYRYASLAQVIKVPDSELLIGMTHLEYQFANKNFNGVLGLSVSKDNGETWTLLGEIITHALGMTVDSGHSRDIGNGIIFMDDKYLYVYAIDWGEKKAGLSVSRVLLTELYDAAKQDKVPEFHKKYNNEWTEKGIGGDFDNVLPEKIGANFCQVVYQPTLKKYLMFITNSKYSANSADIAMLISDTFLDFKDAKIYYVAPSQYGEQYPTVVGTDTKSQTEVGNEFYLYYCHMTQGYQNGLDWQLFWGSCTYMRQKISIKGETNE